MLRLQLAGKRRELRHLRQRKDDADNAFMKVIRPHLTETSSAATIPAETVGRQFAEMQRVRDDYYSAESAYEAMELDLDRGESELQDLEASMYRLVYTPAGYCQESRSRSSEDQESDCDADDSVSRVSLLGISGEREEDIHPLYRHLLDTIGDRELAKEHYEELQGRRDGILYELELKLHRQRLRNNQGHHTLTTFELASLKSSLGNIPTQAQEFEARFGVAVAAEDLEFLREFNAEEASVRATLDRTSSDVERVRNLCIEKRAMRKNPPYNEEYTIYNGAGGLPAGNAAIELNPISNSNLAHPRFPILLSKPVHVLELISPSEALERALKLPKDSPASIQRRSECVKEYGIANLMKKVDGKPDYINQWLIHRLRTSPIEAELLYTVSRSRFNIANIHRWQQDVLYHWRRDEAAKQSSLDYQGPRTPRDELDVVDESVAGVNSAIVAAARAQTDDGKDGAARPQCLRRKTRVSSASVRNAL